MTWYQIANYFEPGISPSKANEVLMSMTGYPFFDVKHTVFQIRRAIRIIKNDINFCEMCHRKHPYHESGCPEICRNNFLEKV